MKVLIVCSGGMSSSIVVQALQKEGSKQGVTINTLAVGASDFEREVQNGWDVALVAPQVRHRYDQFKESADEAGVPCQLIPPQAYNPLGGPKLLEVVTQVKR